MKQRIVMSIALFAAAFILEGVAGRILPFEELAKVVINKA